MRYLDLIMNCSSIQEITPMHQRSALIVASTVTAFTLVVVGAVAARVAQPAAATPATTAPVAASSPTADASVEAAYLQQVDAYYQQREAAYQQQAAAYQQRETVYQQRELQYQQLIKQANEQLHQAYSHPATTQKRVQVHVQAPQAQIVQPTPTPYAISPQTAGAIALAAAPGANLMATPELVSFQGAVAYEVRLDRGNVYVDANTGNVLYNGAAAPPAQTSNASSGQSQHASSSHSDDGGGGGEGGD